MVINFISGLLIHQALQRICYIRNCNCITDTLNRCGSKLCRVDTNNLTVHVQKSTTAVAWVDCCICLDQVCSGIAVAVIIADCIIRIQLTVLGAYNTGCYGLTITKCVTNCNNLCTNLQVIGITDSCNRNGIHCIAVNIIQGNCYNCKILLAVVTFYLSLTCCAVTEANR